MFDNWPNEKTISFLVASNRCFRHDEFTVRRWNLTTRYDSMPKSSQIAQQAVTRESVLKEAKNT